MRLFVKQMSTGEPLWKDGNEYLFADDERAEVKVTVNGTSVKFPPEHFISAILCYTLGDKWIGSCSDSDIEEKILKELDKYLTTEARLSDDLFDLLLLAKSIIDTASYPDCFYGCTIAVQQGQQTSAVYQVNQEQTENCYKITLLDLLPDPNERDITVIITSPSQTDMWS